MTKDLPASILTEIASSTFAVVRLVEAVFENGTFRTTNHIRDIEYNGNTYSAGGNFLDFSDVEESMALQAPTASITLNGIPDSYKSLVLTQEFTGNDIQISLAFLDSDDAVIAVIDDFQGIMNDMSFTDDPGGAASITVNMTFELARFEDVNGFRTNPAEWKKKYPTDTFMDSVPALIDVTRKW